MYQYVLFDLDGTLTDPGIGITNSVAYALKKWNIEVAERSELYKFIGPPLEESFRKYYGFSEEDALKAVEYYREYFKVTGIYENTIYDGTEKLLDAVKKSGRKVVLATSKPQEFAETILKHFHIVHYFDLVAGATMDSSRSKKSDVILYALELCGIQDRSQAVMVGDREHDINGANYAGLDSIGVLCGYGDREELETAGATHIVEKIEDVFELLD